MSVHREYFRSFIFRQSRCHCLDGPQEKHPEEVAKGKEAPPSSLHPQSCCDAQTPPASSLSTMYGWPFLACSTENFGSCMERPALHQKWILTWKSRFFVWFGKFCINGCNAIQNQPVSCSELSTEDDSTQPRVNPGSLRAVRRAGTPQLHSWSHGHVDMLFSPALLQIWGLRPFWQFHFKLFFHKIWPITEYTWRIRKLLQYAFQFSVFKVWKIKC